MALVASLLLPLAAFIGAARAADTSPIVMATDREDSVFTGKWFRRIYVEAFRRMDVPLKITVLPLARISSELDAGHLDGEMLRVLGYAAAHPELVRVEESVLEVGLVLYGANPALRINRVEDIAAAPSLNGEFRRGVGVCETMLRQWLPATNVSSITTTEQGLRKLVAGRTDLFCEFDLAVVDAINSRELNDLGPFRKVLALGAPTPFYAYLHKKNAALAPRLAATLKKMKAEGLIERYRSELEKEAAAAR
jgi:hypothetical protein